MFNFSRDERDYSYILKSNSEELFINLSFDENYLIKYIYFSIISNEDRDGIYRGLKDLEVDTYNGIGGVVKLLHDIHQYIDYHNEEKLYDFESLFHLHKTIYSDIFYLRDKARENIETMSYFKRKRLMKQFNETYKGLL